MNFFDIGLGKLLGKKRTKLHGAHHLPLPTFASEIAPLSVIREEDFRKSSFFRRNDSHTNGGSNAGTPPLNPNEDVELHVGHVGTQIADDVAVHRC